MKTYKVTASLQARGSVEILVRAESAEEAVLMVERDGAEQYEFDGDQFLNLADYETDVYDDAVEHTPEVEKGGEG